MKYFPLWFKKEYRAAQLIVMRSKGVVLFANLRILFWSIALKIFVFVARQILTHSKYPSDICLLVLTILGVGALLSHMSADWSIFARSGSVLVAVSIWMHAWDVKSRLEKRKQIFIQSTLDYSKFEVNLGTPHIDLFDSLIVNASHELSKLKSQYENYDIATVEVRYKGYEITSAIIGTLIWGFGDLIHY